MPVVITAFADKSFTFIKSPRRPCCYRRRLPRSRRGARSVPHLDKVGKLTRARLEAKSSKATKQTDLTAADLDAGVRNDRWIPACLMGIIIAEGVMT